MKINSKAKLQSLLRHTTIFLLLPLAACTATKAPVYPKATPLTIVVSKGTVDLNTEVPGDDYLIPDSQVFVGGRNSKVTSAVASGFGVIGAAIGMSINRTRNASGLEGTEDLFRLNFANLQADAFLRAAENRAAGRYAPMKAKTAPHLVFIPHVRVELQRRRGRLPCLSSKGKFPRRRKRIGKRQALLLQRFRAAKNSGRRRLGRRQCPGHERPGKQIHGHHFRSDPGRHRGKVAVHFAAGQSALRPSACKERVAPGLHAMVLKEYPEYIAVTPAMKDKPFHTVVSIYAIDSVEITQR